MEKLSFCSPTRIFFGRDSIENLAQALNDIKPNAKLLLVYGGGSIILFCWTAIFAIRK